MIAPPPSTFSVLYQGWHDYQVRLIKAIAPLSPEQLALRAAPELRTIGEIVTHIIRVRASWFIFDLHEGGEGMASFMTWDRPGMPTRSAAELVAGLETTWRLAQAVLEHWTPDK